MAAQRSRSKSNQATQSFLGKTQGSRSILVRDVMSRDVRVLAPDATLEEAAREMRDLDVGSLPVYEGEALLGIVTDRDVTIRAVADGLEPSDTCVRDVMTPDAVYCFDDQSVEEAGNIMREKQIRRLPVLDRGMRLAGIIALGDLAVNIGRELSGEVLEEVSEPSSGPETGNKRLVSEGAGASASEDLPMKEASAYETGAPKVNSLLERPEDEPPVTEDEKSQGRSREAF